MDHFSLNKHRFAFFVPEISILLKKNKANKQIIISDLAVVHRLLHVVRFAVNDQCILFDQLMNAHCMIKTLTKKELICDIQSIHENKKLIPEISVLLPLLKRDHLDEALYSLIEIGVQKITLIITEKSQRSFSLYEAARLERVMIAASEQSKNFYFPEISQAVPFSIALHEAQGKKILFDPQGVALSTLLQSKNNIDSSITLLVGPEGGLTEPEIEFAKVNNFKLCVLTPTVLRAHQAIALAAGIMRSWYR